MMSCNLQTVPAHSPGCWLRIEINVIRRAQRTAYFCKKIGILVLVARSLCYYGGTEASFVFEKRFTSDLLILEVRICEYLSNFTGEFKLHTSHLPARWISRWSRGFSLLLLRGKKGRGSCTFWACAWWKGLIIITHRAGSGLEVVSSRQVRGSKCCNFRLDTCIDTAILL